MSSSIVNYTSVYTNSEPWRFQWVSDDELEAPEVAPQSPGQAPPSPDYVPGPEHPPLPDYVPGPEEPEQAPLSPDYIPEPEYPEYLVSSDAKAPIEDQPLPVDASPTALSSGYIANSDPKEDPEEDPGEDPVDYPANGRKDDDDDSSNAPADSSTIPVDDPVPLAEDTEAFETDESALTHVPSPIVTIPSPPLPIPSPHTHTNPTYDEAPLGYRAAGIRLRAASISTHHPSEIPSPPLLLPSTSHRDDIPKADMPLWKRARFTTPTSRSEVGESSVTVAARQLGLDVATDDMVEDMEERAPTTVEGLSQRVRDLSTTLARDTHEIHVRFEDAQDDQALQRAQSTHCLETGDIIFTQLCFWRARLGTPGRHGDMPWTMMT
ncbi:hypothetical protein Tco_0272720 [Tanacetum coccineum]